MGIESSRSTPLALACRIVGSQSALARLVGKHQSTVHEALRLDKPIWPEAVLTIEAATGISRHYQRPDLYPRDDAAAIDALEPTR